MSDGEASPSGEHDGHDGHDGHGERNAAIERRFLGLPTAASPAYWAALADTAQATRLELEILVMCARERLAAGARDHAEHALGLLWGRVQGETRGLIEAATPQRARNRAGIIEDIMQDCVTALWLEIAQKEETFLTRGFWRKLRFMIANTITQGLIAEGVRTRAGVKQAERVPQNQMDSASQPITPDGVELGQTIADSHAREAFDLVETRADLLAALKGLTAEQWTLFWNTITERLTQTELAARLGVTDRTIRLRIVAMRTQVRKRLYGLDDPGDSPGAGGVAGGAAPGSEEG